MIGIGQWSDEHKAGTAIVCGGRPGKGIVIAEIAYRRCTGSEADREAFPSIVQTVSKGAANSDTRVFGGKDGRVSHENAASPRQEHSPGSKGKGNACGELDAAQ